MKKILLIVFILLLASCAGTQSKYIIPQHIIDRPIFTQYNEVFQCVSFVYPDESTLFVTGDKEPNAMAKGQNVYLTEGIFVFEDDAILFITAHELSHIKLGHLRNKQALSLVTTGAFMVLNTFVPGAGWLNMAANPAIVNNYSKPQELEADKLASDSLVRCFNIPVDKQVQILQSMKSSMGQGGGFWSQHPSWDDRIKNISP